MLTNNKRRERNRNDLLEQILCFTVPEEGDQDQWQWKKTSETTTQALTWNRSETSVLPEEQSTVYSRLHQGLESQNWDIRVWQKSSFYSFECHLPPESDVFWIQTANTADSTYVTLSRALSNVPARLGHKGLVFGNSSDKPLAKSTLRYREGWVWVWWIRMAGRYRGNDKCVIRFNSKVELLCFQFVLFGVQSLGPKILCQIELWSANLKADCVNTYPYFCATQ